MSFIEGDGIGPEIAQSIKDIFAAAKVRVAATPNANSEQIAYWTFPQAPITWELVTVDPIIKDGKTAIPDEAIANIEKNKVALKGPLAVRFP